MKPSTILCTILTAAVFMLIWVIVLLAKENESLHESLYARNSVKKIDENEPVESRSTEPVSEPALKEKAPQNRNTGSTEGIRSQLRYITDKLRQVDRDLELYKERQDLLREEENRRFERAERERKSIPLLLPDGTVEPTVTLRKPPTVRKKKPFSSW